MRHLMLRLDSNEINWNLWENGKVNFSENCAEIHQNLLFWCAIKIPGRNEEQHAIVNLRRKSSWSFLIANMQTLKFKTSNMISMSTEDHQTPSPNEGHQSTLARKYSARETNWTWVVVITSTKPQDWNKNNRNWMWKHIMERRRRNWP